MDRKKKGASEVIADAVRKKEPLREIYCGDAVAPDSKTHCSSGSCVEERAGGMRGQTEQVDTMNDGHRERDQEQEQESGKSQEWCNDPEHPGEASLGKQ